MTLEEVLKNFWLGDDLLDVINYFVHLYEKYKGKNVRILVMNNQCFSLLKACINMQDIVSKEEFNSFLAKSIITKEELIKEVPEMVHSVQSGKEPPKIILLDFILFYGRRANEVLLDFEKAIKIEIVNNRFADFILNYLISCVDIWAYARPEISCLLLSRYIRNIKFEKQFQYSYRDEKGEKLLDSEDLHHIDVNILLKNLMLMSSFLSSSSQTFPADIVETIDNTLYAIALETERYAISRTESRVLLSDKCCAEWNCKSYTIEDFVDYCKMSWNKKKNYNTELTSEIIKELLLQRDKEGYLTLFKDKEGVIDVRVLPQSLLIKPMRYCKYIDVLVAIYQRCCEGYLDIMDELRRLETKLKEQDNILFPVKELFDFLQELKTINQNIGEWNFYGGRPSWGMALRFCDYKIVDQDDEDYRIQYMAFQRYRKI